METEGRYRGLPRCFQLLERIVGVPGYSADIPRPIFRTLVSDDRQSSGAVRQVVLSSRTILRFALAVVLSPSVSFATACRLTCCLSFPRHSEPASLLPLPPRFLRRPYGGRLARTYPR
jgi:hypothetical protein